MTTGVLRAQDVLAAILCEYADSAVLGDVTRPTAVRERVGKLGVCGVRADVADGIALSKVDVGPRRAIESFLASLGRTGPSEETSSASRAIPSGRRRAWGARCHSGKPEGAGGGVDDSGIGHGVRAGTCSSEFG